MKLVTNSERNNLHPLWVLSTELKKDGESRNQVPEKVFKSEEGWDVILKILFL